MWACTLCAHDLHVEVGEAAGRGQRQLDHALHRHGVAVQVVKQGAVLVIVRHQPELSPRPVICTHTHRCNTLQLTLIRQSRPPTTLLQTSRLPEGRSCAVRQTWAAAAVNRLQSDPCEPELPHTVVEPVCSQTAEQPLRYPTHFHRKHSVCPNQECSSQKTARLAHVCIKIHVNGKQPHLWNQETEVGEKLSRGGTQTHRRLEAA